MLHAAEQPLDAPVVEAELDRSGPPVRDQLIDRERRALDLPGRQSGGLGRARARRPALGQRRLDLRAPAAERPQHRLRDTDQLGDPVADRQPLQPESPGELRAQDRLVDEARRPRVRVQPPAIQRRPAPVRAAAEVRDQDVGVQLRIPGPRGAMPKRRRHQPAGPARPQPRHGRGGPPPPNARDSRRLRERRGRARRGPRARSSRSPIPNRTLTLFGAENVRSKPATSYRARRAPQRRPIQRIKAGEDAPQRIAVDRARRGRAPRRRADPRAARFSAAGVVLLHAVADAVDRVHAHLALLEVVPGLAGRQLADRKHRMR